MSRLAAYLTVADVELLDRLPSLDAAFDELWARRTREVHAAAHNSGGPAHEGADEAESDLADEVVRIIAEIRYAIAGDR